MRCALKSATAAEQSTNPRTWLSAWPRRHEAHFGLWIAKEEGASFWAQVYSNVSNRGVKDVFVVCCDGLKGLPEEVEATWPNSMAQTCIVHLIRAANRWASYQNRKTVSRTLRDIYTAADESTAWLL